mgnify:CR=1 FL=1
MRYVLGETLQEYQEEIMEKDRPSVFLATSQTARDCLEQAGMQYEGEINLKDVGFCKMETQQECLFVFQSFWIFWENDTRSYFLLTVIIS